MAKKSAGGTPATSALTRAGIAFTLHPYAHADGANNFGEEAAAALGVDRDRIFKTLVVDAGGELVVAVVPVARQLDLKALADAVGAKKRRAGRSGGRGPGYRLRRRAASRRSASGRRCVPSLDASADRVRQRSSSRPASAGCRSSWLLTIWSA